MFLNKIANKFYYNSDIISCVILIIFGIVALLLGFKLKNYRLTQIATVLILAAITYLILRNRFPNSIVYLTKNEISKSKFICTSIIFYLTLLFGMLIINQNLYSRPLSFLIIISISAGIIAIQIISVQNKYYYHMILFEILFLGIIVRASVFYQFDGLVGGDPWVHLNSINSIITFGHVTNQVAGYYYFPFMHIFVSFVYYLTGFNVVNSMFFIGLCDFLSLVFIFLVVKKFYDYKIGLISLLVLSVATYPIVLGFGIIPQSFGVAYLSILIYLFFIQTDLGTIYKKMIYSIFIIIFLTCNILTHTINSFVTLVILFAIFLVDTLKYKISDVFRLNKEVQNYISITLILLFFIFLIYYWFYSSGFIGYIGESLKWGFSSTYQEQSVTTVSESFITTFMKMLSLYVFSFFALLGSLFTLKVKSFKTIGIYGWVLLLVVFGLVFLNLNNFLPARWFVYIQICLIVPVAISIIILSQTSFKKALTIFLIISLFSFIGLISYEANAQNVNPFTPTPTGGVKYSEIKVGIFDKIPTNINIYADLGYHGINLNRVGDASDILSGKKQLNGILLFRTSLEQSPYYVGGNNFGIESLNSSFLIEMQRYNRIYDSGSVIAFDGYF